MPSLWHTFWKDVQGGVQIFAGQNGPPEYDGFLEVAGQKEVDVFYQTMHLVEKGATKWGYDFTWYYDRNTNEWAFTFTDTSEVKRS